MLELWQGTGSTQWSTAGLAPSAEVVTAQGCHLLPMGLHLSQVLDEDLETALCLHLSGAGTNQASFEPANFMSLRCQGF